MRAGYLFLSVLIMTGLTACQQESTSVTAVVQSEADAPAQQAVQPETGVQAETPIDGSVPETAKQIVEEAVKEVAAASVAPESPVAPKPAVVSPPLVEKSAAVTRAVQEVKPVVVVEKVSGDPVQGKSVARKCGACHTFDQGGKNKTGPNLFGVFGRIKGGVAGFDYGSYLQAENAAGAVWDEASLRSWHADSKAAAKAGGGTTKMPTQKITGTKADDLIAYLKSLK